MSNTFLQAEWRKLVIGNYAIKPSILLPYLPAGTELDLWRNTCYVSLVGFMFLNTKVMGLKIPFHINFPEVNLRFYVRYCDKGTWKRGVVFIKEIVPKFMLSFVANTLYNENYETMPMQHNWHSDTDTHRIDYKWKKNHQWQSIGIQTDKVLRDIAVDSEEEFITEHYWGYTKINDQRTSEYGVEHPRWQVYDTLGYHIATDFRLVYGDDFTFLNHEKPESVFMAEGSAIEVKKGNTIKQ